MQDDDIVLFLRAGQCVLYLFSVFGSTGVCVLKLPADKKLYAVVWRVFGYSHAVACLIFIIFKNLAFKNGAERMSLRAVAGLLFQVSKIVETFQAQLVVI